MPTKEISHRHGANFNEELVKPASCWRRRPAPEFQGQRIRFEGGKKTITDGPFTETKELIAGFWLWQVRSMDEPSSG